MQRYVAAAHLDAMSPQDHDAYHSRYATLLLIQISGAEGD